MYYVSDDCKIGKHLEFPSMKNSVGRRKIFFFATSEIDYTFLEELKDQFVIPLHEVIQDGHRWAYPLYFIFSLLELSIYCFLHLIVYTYVLIRYPVRYISHLLNGAMIVYKHHFQVIKYGVITEA